MADDAHRATQPRTGRAPSVRHALALLSLLAGRAAPLPAATIARELGLPRSSTYHLLAALREEGYIAHFPEERRFGLGVAVVELGSGYARQQPLQRLARPLLARLAERCGHNTHLAVLHGRDVVYVVEERVAGQPSLVSDVGVRLPATLTASGLAILSELPPAQVRALFPDPSAFVQRHESGPTSLSALRRVLAATRQTGFAVEVGSVTPGLASVAAAARDYSGHPVAGVAITMPVPGPARRSVEENPARPRVRSGKTRPDEASGRGKPGPTRRPVGENPARPRVRSGKTRPDEASGRGKPGPATRPVEENPAPEEMARLAAMARECAVEVSARLGYRGAF